MPSLYHAMLALISTCSHAGPQQQYRRNVRRYSPHLQVHLQPLQQGADEQVVVPAARARVLREVFQQLELQQQARELTAMEYPLWSI
jgi:hypothetical protein